MTSCLFATDLHGRIDRYEKLFAVVEEERPDALFLGGDLLPHAFVSGSVPELGGLDFFSGLLESGFRLLRAKLGPDYPAVFVILGNDDGRMEEELFLEAEEEGLWTYAHGRRSLLGSYAVYGYSYVPPTPFQLKDWERYDVSRFVDAGCVSPEEGQRSVAVPPSETRFSTIRNDLQELVGDAELSRAIFLMHSPPYKTLLDRAALDGMFVDHVPLDVHCGSIAIRRMIEARQPLLTLHGHIHESTRLTGSWRDQLGRTTMFNAAHDGDELSLIRFTMEDLAAASRELR